MTMPLPLQSINLFQITNSKNEKATKLGRGVDSELISLFFNYAKICLF